MVLALWIVPLLLAPPLFSRDIYSYAAQGEMMSHHISPYHYGPGVLGAAPSVTRWSTTCGSTPRCPTGRCSWRPTGFRQCSGRTTSWSTSCCCGCSPSSGSGSWPCRSRRWRAVWARSVPPSRMAVLNPVTILHLVGGAHNDALMLGLLMAGLAVARRGRPVAGIVLCALAAAVKVPAALGVFYIGWDWMGPGCLRARIRPRGHRWPDRAGGHGCVVGRHRSRVELGVEPVAPRGPSGRGWRPPPAAGIFLTDLAHLVGIGVSLHTSCR